LRSPFEEERLSDDPSSLYTLGEPSDSTAASDTSSNNRQQLVQVGAGTAVVFGNATGPGTDGLTAAEFAAGKYLRASDTFYSTTVGYTLHCFVNCSATATDSLIAGFGDETAGSSASLAAGYWALAVGSTGKLVLRNPAGGGTILLTSTTTIEDGATHAVAVVDDVAAGTVKLYVDGIEEASGVSPDALVSPTRLFVGPAFTGSVAHVTTGPPTSQPRLAAYSQAGLTGFAGDTPAERLARYVSYGAIYDSVSFEIGSATLSHIDINGVTALDAMRKVEATEGGVLFDGKDGSLVFHGRSHRYGATSAFTISTALQTVGSGIQPTLDRSALRNDVTAALADGTVTAPFSDQASIADYGLARESLELHTSDPDAPIAAATWLVNSYKEPGVRIGSLEVDLMGLIGSAYGSGPYGSGPYGGSAAFEALLAADIGTRFTLADMPTQNAETSTDYFIEGYTETIGVGTWTMTLNVSPARVYDVFTIDDPVLGQIDGPYLIAR